MAGAGELADQGLSNAASPAPRKLRGGWYVQREGARYVLARHWPPRFDVVAVGEFPPVRAGRLAQQIRQDIWRELRGLRGFSPVIIVDATECGTMRIRAGGRLLGTPPQRIRDRLQSLLDSPVHRARWLNWAGERGK